MTREEFNVLALEHLEEITAFAGRLAGNAADADDLVQATFERAFASWRDLRQPVACRAWLFRIARNLFVDGKRAAVRSQLELVLGSEEVIPAFIVPAEAVERIEARELEAALTRLPREQREVLLLCDLWGFQYAEIAGIVDSPIGTVRSRIARARARLSALLGGTAKESKGLRTVTCEQIAEFLSPYVDGELAPKERSEVDAHLDGCASCLDQIASVRSVKHAIARVASSEEPPGAVRARVEALRFGKAGFASARKPVWMAGVAFLLAAILTTVAVRNARSPGARIAEELVRDHLRWQVGRGSQADGLGRSPAGHTILRGEGSVHPDCSASARRQSDWRPALQDRREASAAALLHVWAADAVHFRPGPRSWRRSLPGVPWPPCLRPAVREFDRPGRWRGSRKHARTTSSRSHTRETLGRRTYEGQRVIGCCFATAVSYRSATCRRSGKASRAPEEIRAPGGQETGWPDQGGTRRRDQGVDGEGGRPQRRLAQGRGSGAAKDTSVEAREGSRRQAVAGRAQRLFRLRGFCGEGRDEVRHRRLHAGQVEDELKETEVIVHKVNGKERYTWFEENGTWKKKPVE